MEKFYFIVDFDHIGIRLDAFLKEYFPEQSRSTVQKWIDADVLVNHTLSKVAYKLRFDDRVSVSVPSFTHLTYDENPIEILFEDEALIILNKPKGLLVHPDKLDHHSTLINRLAFYYHQTQQNILDQVERNGVVHRLDKATTGVIIFAKTQSSYLSLKQQFQNRTIQKCYHVIVHGRVKNDRIAIYGNVGRVQGSCKMTIKDSGKESSTQCEVIQRFTDTTYLRVFPRTGRTHQIRLHLLQISHSVLGDMVYNHNKKKHMDKNTPLFLHAKSIELIHPISSKKLKIQAALPSYFLNYIDLHRDEKQIIPSL